MKRADREKRSGPYPYYGASGVIDSIDDFLFDGDFLLVAEDGANLLSRSTPIAFCATGKFWVNNHAHVVRAKPGMSQSYLEHFLNATDLAPYVTGTAQPKLTQKKLNTLTVRVPPKNEQRRIVAKIEALTARSRRAKEALDAIPPLLDKLRQSILAAAFRGDLTADWRAAHPDVEPASELLKRIRIERRQRWEEAELAKMRAKGKMPKDDRWKAKYKEPARPDDRSVSFGLPASWAWASTAEVADCLDSARKPVTRAKRVPGPYPYYGANGQVDSVDQYIFDEELVLVTEDETFYGRTKPIAYRVSGKCWVNNHAHVLRAAAPIAPDLLCYQLMHYPVTPWLSGTTGRAKLTQGDLNVLPLAIPPEEEAAVLEGRLTRALEAVSGLPEQTSLVAGDLSRLDGLILTRAFLGQLVRQDPSDVPASTLLEEIHGKASIHPKHAKLNPTGRVVEEPV